MTFTIRDLFLVTAIVALAVGWRVDRRNLADQLNSSAKKISGLGQELQDRTEEILKLKEMKNFNPSYPPAP